MPTARVRTERPGLSKLRRDSGNCTRSPAKPEGSGINDSYSQTSPRNRRSTNSRRIPAWAVSTIDLNLQAADDDQPTDSVGLPRNMKPGKFLCKQSAKQPDTYESQTVDRRMNPYFLNVEGQSDQPRPHRLILHTRFAKRLKPEKIKTAAQESFRSLQRSFRSPFPTAATS